MMVISQLDFRKYLDNQTDPVAAAASAFLPQLVSLEPQYQRGDIDILIIHRLYGLLAWEVKTVGLERRADHRAILDRLEETGTF
jgi:hypothetical protein